MDIKISTAALLLLLSIVAGDMLGIQGEVEIDAREKNNSNMNPDAVQQKSNRAIHSATVKTNLSEGQHPEEELKEEFYEEEPEFSEEEPEFSEEEPTDDSVNDVNEKLLSDFNNEKVANVKIGNSPDTKKLNKKDNGLSTVKTSLSEGQQREEGSEEESYEEEPEFSEEEPTDDKVNYVKEEFPSDYNNEKVANVKIKISPNLEKLNKNNNDSPTVETSLSEGKYPEEESEEESYEEEPEFSEEEPTDDAVNDVKEEFPSDYNNEKVANAKIGNSPDTKKLNKKDNGSSIVEASLSEEKQPEEEFEEESYEEEPEFSEEEPTDDSVNDVKEELPSDYNDEKITNVKIRDSPNPEKSKKHNNDSSTVETSLSQE